MLEAKQVTQAEKLYLRALAVDRKALSTNNVYLATILDGLVAVYTAAHKENDAKQFALTAQTIREKALGKNAELIASLPPDYQFLSRVQNYASGAESIAASVKEVQSGADPKLLAAAEAQRNAKANRPVKDKWALVIGISKYQDQGINLKYSAKDARDFYNYLIKEAHFQPDHIRLLLDEQATRENILACLGDKWLPRVAGPDDLVVFYFSGHGSPSKADLEGNNYLIAYNTDKDSLYATGIRIQDFTDMIKERVHSDRMVLCMDACHSGAAEPGSKSVYRVSNFSVDQIVQGCGQFVVCSSQPNQVSWESKEYPNGVFTHYLLEGLRKNAKLGDACDYMKEMVQREVLKDRGELQTPVIGSHWQGEAVVLAVPPSSPSPGIPDDIIKPSATGSTPAIKGTKSAAMVGKSTQTSTKSSMQRKGGASKP